MPVRIAAVLDLDTVAGLLTDLTPFTVNLGNEADSDRWMHVERPETLELVAGTGVRIRTSARLQWTVAGVHIPFTIRTVVILLGLELAETAQGGRLCVLPFVEEADLKNVPDMIDDKLVEIVNSRLAAKAGELGWGFGQLLAVRLRLPPELAGVDGFEMDAKNATLRVTADAIHMELDLPMRFTRDAPR